ncbi:MAG: hypothetical protein PHW64_05960 [Sulfuricurvum sp.]|nr:hypothetical protein [Sulfuricurvum sp.]
MKNALATGLIFLLMIFTGCASKNDALEEMKKELLNDTPIAVYTLPASGIYAPERWVKQTIFQEFPFITPLLSFDFQGKFHEDFYDQIEVSWNAVSLDKVDWDVLTQNSDGYDIIYAQSVGIAESGPLENDYAVNLAKAYNISPAKMESLKKWVENGGVFWVESGIKASRFETFYPYGGINDAKTIGLFAKEQGRLFSIPIQYKTMKSTSVDMVNYETEAVLLHAPVSAAELKGVKNVNFKPVSFIESYPVIQSHPLLVDTRGSVYAGYATLGKGIVLTTVPTNYWQADDDGELYRWKLLSWILQRKGIDGAKQLENPKLRV